MSGPTCLSVDSSFWSGLMSRKGARTQVRCGTWALRSGSRELIRSSRPSRVLGSSGPGHSPVLGPSRGRSPCRSRGRRRFSTTEGQVQREVGGDGHRRETSIVVRQVVSPGERSGPARIPAHQLLAILVDRSQDSLQIRSPVHTVCYINGTFSDKLTDRVGE